MADCYLTYCISSTLRNFDIKCVTWNKNLGEFTVMESCSAPVWSWQYLPVEANFQIWVTSCVSICKVWSQVVCPVFCTVMNCLLLQYFVNLMILFSLMRNTTILFAGKIHYKVVGICKTENLSGVYVKCYIAKSSVLDI